MGSNAHNNEANTKQAQGLSDTRFALTAMLGMELRARVPVHIFS